MKHRYITLFIIVLLAPFCTLDAKNYTVASPGGHIKATVETSSCLHLQISMNGETLLGPSFVGLCLDRDLGVFDHPEVAKVERMDVRQAVNAHLYRQKVFSLNGREMTLRMKNGWGYSRAGRQRGRGLSSLIVNSTTAPLQQPL